MEKIGLIAGNRKFPLIFAQAAKARGCCVIAVAVKGETSRRLNSLADKVYWLRLSDFSKMFDIFQKERVEQVAMAGQISPRRLFCKEVQKSREINDLLDSIEDKKADTIFGAIAEKLKEKGFEIINSNRYLEEYIPAKGSLTKREPDFTMWEDIYFGLRLAKAIAYLDIGQTVAVKAKAIVAVEALEGTDNLIRRAGRLAFGGITVVKVSKPMQDLRFDIPVAGLNTVKNLVKAKAKCLAIEAGKTLFIDKEKSARLADKHRISIVAV